jgi:uncharacterized FlgJ-related protein
MYYKFDEKRLAFKKVTTKEFLLFILFFVIVTFLVSVVMATQMYRTIIVTEEAKVIVMKQYNEFSKEKLKEYVLQLNIKFPQVVLAQAELESGHFKSVIFKENNNFFGMKEAKLRPTTNKGGNRGHAVYDSWRDCVVDYALYQTTYLNDIKSQDEYLDYLKQNYAEDPNYILRLKEIIKKNNR